MLGITGGRDAFMVKDLYSGLKHLYPTKSKHAEDTQLALQNFIGARGSKMLYSDRSGEINVACRSLKIYPFRSQPGMPQNNALIEPANQDVMDGVCTNLNQAGLPVCFWPMAA